MMGARAMGYYDVSVVVDGALGYDDTVSEEDLDARLDEFREQSALDDSTAGEGARVWEVYVLWHDHAVGIECECAQYVTDHRPELVMRDGVEVDA